MAGSTPVFGLAYFDFRDRLDSGVNIQKEINRFLIIDRQLFGLYSIFGNGVIEGLDIIESNSSPFSIEISTGTAIINYLAVENLAPKILSNIPSNSSLGIYAIITGNTVQNRKIDFIYSSSPLGDNAILIGEIITNSNGIANISSLNKQTISFLQLIENAVNSHKHRGTPSKIDLQLEVKNRLPSSRIEDFDASKIKSGKLNENRLPIINHDSLDNSGILTHPQLDSFVRSLSSGNRQLLAEVSSVNLLKHMIYLKYKHSDSDEHILNTILYIPGISNRNLIDIDNSTANISYLSNCISGVPPKTEGRISSVSWETSNAFFSAFEKRLINISSNSVTIQKGSSRSQVIENFETSQGSGNPIAGFSQESQVISDNIKVVSYDSDNFKTEGFFSGRFSTDKSLRAIYTKTISSNNDWSNFDEIVMDIKCLSIQHGIVSFYFVNVNDDGEEIESQKYSILSKDEVTSNFDPDKNGFETRVINIAGEERNNVTKIVFLTDDTISKFTFFIDNIFLRSDAIYAQQGIIKFRFSSSANVVFNSIFYEGDQPEGTDIRVRAKVANSVNLLQRASFTNYLDSGSVFDREGTAIEIEVYLISNSERDKTPTLSSLELQYISDSEEVGFVIDSEEEFNRGIFENIEIDDSFLSIASPVSVGNFYFANNNLVNEISPGNIAVYGFTGSDILLSPVQALNFVSNQGQRGLDNPLSCVRLRNKNFLICDTYNDRVIEVDQNGNLIRGIGSHNSEDQDQLYPLTAVYNPRLGVLTTTFSKEIDRGSIDMSKISLFIGSSRIFLGTDDSVVNTFKPNNILDISLSSDKKESLETVTSELVTVLYSQGAFSESFGSSLSSRQLSGLNGIRVFISDFSYIQGINRPVFANILSNNNWIIGNSFINFDEDSDTDSSDIFLVRLNETKSNTITTEEFGPNNEFEIIGDNEEIISPLVEWQVSIPSEIVSAVSYTTNKNNITFNISPKLDSQLGTFVINLTAIYKNPNNQQTLGTVQKPFNLQISSPISSAVASGNISSGDQSVDSSVESDSVNQGFFTGGASSIIEINPSTLDVSFTYSDILFSEFSLGGMLELDNNRIAVAGIYSLSSTLPQSESSSIDEDYLAQASRKLSGYRGKFLVIDKESSSVLFQYDSPDGLYSSDVDIDNNGYFVIAESSFASNSGRIIKIDSFGNIIFQLGAGLFTRISDAKSLLNNNLFIST